MKTFVTATVCLLLMVTDQRSARADLPSTHPAPAPARSGHNAAVIYWQAFGMLPSFRDRWNEPGKVLLHFLTTPLDETVADMVQAAEPSLRQLRRAIRIDQVDWALNEEAGADVEMPHLSKAHLLAKYAVLSARLKFSRGQAAEGVADLIATLRMGRHLGVSPYFSALSEDLGIEWMVMQTVAANMKSMDAASLKQLQAGLEAMPPGGTMIAVMHRSRQYAAGLVRDAGAADPKEVPALVEKHLGKRMADVLATRKKEELLAGMKELLTLADKCAEIMRIPDDKIAQFEEQRGQITEGWNDLCKKYPWMPYPLTPCVDAIDRYLEGKARVQGSMVRAAIAYRLGGNEAFQKIVDPYAGGPFEAKVGDGTIEMTSKLRVGSEAIKLTFTLPAEAGTGAAKP